MINLVCLWKLYKKKTLKHHGKRLLISVPGQNAFKIALKMMLALVTHLVASKSKYLLHVHFSNSGPFICSSKNSVHCFQVNSNNIIGNSMNVDSCRSFSFWKGLGWWVTQEKMTTCILKKNKLIFSTWNKRHCHSHMNMMLLMGMFFLDSLNAVFFRSQSFVSLLFLFLLYIPPMFFFMSDNFLI